MNELNTINQFFSAIDCHFKCYEMGRLIQAVKPQQFIDFELGNTPWDTPFMQYAWIGVVFWQKKEAVAEQNHTVWFLKLPLDEQAKLNLAARDDFLSRLFKTLEHALANKKLATQEPGDKVPGHQKLSNKKSAGEQFYSLENAMKDNPYGFQPKQEQLANFHAIVQQQLNLAASSSYQDAQDYFSDSAHFDQWQQLGFQGIADLAARLEEKVQCPDRQAVSNQQLIIKAIPRLPLSSFHALSLCLENHVVSRALAQAVFDKLSLASDNNTSSSTSCIACIRATAGSSDSAGEIQAQLLTNVLSSPFNNDIEVLAIIAGRCWQALFLQQNILLLFLKSLAHADSSRHPGAFNAIVSDLIFIPGMRDKILQGFRSPDRSEQLILAIAAFLKQSRAVKH